MSGCNPILVDEFIYFHETERYTLALFRDCIRLISSLLPMWFISSLRLLLNDNSILINVARIEIIIYFAACFTPFLHWSWLSLLWKLVLLLLFAWFQSSFEECLLNVINLSWLNGTRGFLLNWVRLRFLSHMWALELVMKVYCFLLIFCVVHNITIVSLGSILL